MNYKKQTDLIFSGYRITKQDKDKVEKLARKERRTQSGMVRHLISSYGSKKLEAVSEGDDKDTIIKINKICK